MATSDALRLHEALQRLHRRAQQDHRLVAEFQRARREFFGVEDSTRVRPAAELRFLEWALLERESLALAAVPLDVLSLPGDDELLRGSVVGVYRLETVQDDRADARDLQDDDTVELLVPPGALQPGDLMVGRLYGTARSGWQPSGAIAIYRPGQTLAAAFQRDLARLGLERRLTQLELEHLLLRQQTPDRELHTSAAASPRVVDTAPRRQVEHVEAELEEVLAAGGAPGLATQISDSLAQSVRPGEVIGPMLDQLAFDTKVDLDRAQRAMLELWSAHHEEEAPAEAAPAEELPEVAELPGETLGQRLVRTLDEGLAQKRDVAELFRQLEAMAGIESDEEEDDDDGFGAAGRSPRDPNDEDLTPDVGDLDPLVTEWLWETRQEGSQQELFLRTFLELQQNAAIPHTNVDDVTGQDLMRLLLHVYLQARADGRAVAVRGAFAALQGFSSWAEATQELSLGRALQDCRGSLLDHLERLQDLGLRLSSPADPRAGTPSLLHVEDVGLDGIGLRDDDEDHWLPLARDVAALARPGDLLLAALRPDGKGKALAGPVVALPADAEALAG